MSQAGDAEIQTSPTHTLAYRIGQPMTRVWFRSFHNAQWFHPERMPDSGPVLVVANHQSYYDPPLIGGGIKKRPLDYLARAGLFKNPLFGRFISAFNAFPIKEDTGDRAALNAVIDRLHAGGAVLLFPEGRRTRDGHVMPLKRGMALILRKARCPLLPVAVDGVYDVFPPGQKRPSLFRGPIGVHYGEPIMPDELPRHAEPLLSMLHERLEAQRLELRLELLKKSGGKFPMPLSPKTLRAVE
ncbi:MAG: 1-acyl-sn-glycerol-3-phosphate acyltransferase [Phycisphaerales bacterium]|nr:1-acyl-sn-glycerol-3-phosphate acyltransferase [Phycisphaerales bacterium]